MDHTLTTLREVLTAAAGLDEAAWVYLPAGAWTLETPAAVLRSEEVPPELEDEPDAGVPAFARERNLRQVLPVATVQEIVANFREQQRDATAEQLLKGFLFYWEHDAFIEL